MATSVISRQLCARLCPRRAPAGAAPLSFLPNRASLSSSAITFAKTPSVVTPVHGAWTFAGQTLHTSLQTDLRRTFSSISINGVTDNGDDGGPVASMNIPMKDLSNEELADMSTVPGWNQVHSPPREYPRGALVGTVVSDKMNKTVNVAVDRWRIVPKYRKRLRYTKKFMAHDEHEVCNMGDMIMIVPCQKISRHKHFMVREIIRAKGQL